MANLKNTLLQLDDIFSAPLLATINADMQVSENIIRLISEIGFEKGDQNKLRMLSFSYKDSNGNSTNLEVPLLSLIPLPMLNVSRADFQFDVEVYSYYEVKEPETLSLLEDEAPEVEMKPRIRANFARSKGNDKALDTIATTEMNAKMNVSIQMQQTDLPGGMSNFLNLINGLVVKED